MLFNFFNSYVQNKKTIFFVHTLSLGTQSFVFGHPHFTAHWSALRQPAVPRMRSTDRPGSSAVLWHCMSSLDCFPWRRFKVRCGPRRSGLSFFQPPSCLCLRRASAIPAKTHRTAAFSCKPLFKTSDDRRPVHAHARCAG